MSERRWLVIASDGRHGTVGRATDPSTEELEQAAENLRGQGLAGWLAIGEGRYHGPGPLRLLMVRPLAEVAGATWQDAEAAFTMARSRAAVS